LSKSFKASDNMAKTKKERVLAAIQGDIPLVKRPFRKIAETVGLEEEEVLDLIAGVIEKGLIRKFSGILHHQRAGFKKNAMILWAAPAGGVTGAGEALSAFKEVTHCYERTPPFEGRYNLFTMVHFPPGDTAEFVRGLSQAAGVTDYRILVSLEEFKKSSMEYF
jgi:DNA-binding Lrp family transcriptional regulator